jgi:hypothetical protein
VGPARLLARWFPTYSPARGYRTFRAKSGALILKIYIDQELAQSPISRRLPNGRTLLQAALRKTAARFCSESTTTPSSGSVRATCLSMMYLAVNSFPDVGATGWSRDYIYSILRICCKNQRAVELQDIVKKSISPQPVWRRSLQLVGESGTVDLDVVGSGPEEPAQHLPQAWMMVPSGSSRWPSSCVSDAQRVGLAGRPRCIRYKRARADVMPPCRPSRPYR